MPGKGCRNPIFNPSATTDTRPTGTIPGRDKFTAPYTMYYVTHRMIASTHTTASAITTHFHTSISSTIWRVSAGCQQSGIQGP